MWQQAHGRTGETVHANVDGLRACWQERSRALAAELPGVHIEQDGEALYVGELSPGCRCCKDGTWDCVFLTGHCNLACSFCCSPLSLAEAPAGSAFGRDVDEIAANHERTHIRGISFSGGEPLLEPERLCSWLARLKRRCPSTYFWAYTNGVLANEPTIGRLADLGLDELRFNVAATGWDDPQVLAHMLIAVRRLPRVTVEVPSIPWQAAMLTAALPMWADMGVRHLNLHELMYEPGSRSGALAARRGTAARRSRVVLADGHVTEIDADSHDLTIAVMRTVQALGLPLAVNDCSLLSKLRQLDGRRRSLAPLVSRPYEQLRAGRYESFCAYNGQEVHHIHPLQWQSARRALHGYAWLRLERLAPLSVNEPDRWVTCEAPAE